ncbi:hypothetical protein Q9233_017413 [Columba guinea]|nr:hypothetical protein Q9233_017413 [Columba guinea]
MADGELPVLPVPVWIRILELLPVRDRLRAASVCRLGRDLVRDRALWRDVDVRPDEGPEHFVLRGSFITDSAVEFIGRHMRRLRFLEIRSAESLTNAGLECLTSLRDLETLGLDLSDRVSLGVFITLCQALPWLRNLRLAVPHRADEGWENGVKTANGKIKTKSI